jgi:hypothetical protein
VAETETFALEPSPRRLHVIEPEDGAHVRSGEVALAAAVEGWHEPLPRRRAHWTSDVEGDLAEGLETFARIPPGRHVLTVTAPDGLGGEVSASVRVTVD